MKATEKGEDLTIQLKNDLEEWEKNVGIYELDERTKDQLKNIARKSEDILRDSD